MYLKYVQWLIFHIILAVNVRRTIQMTVPPSTNNTYTKEDHDPLESAKAEYKSGEIHVEDTSPITLIKIKQRLKDTGVFDWQDPTLNDIEKKELNKLFEAVEIMTLSRGRQPSSVQNMFASLRLVERAVKKQLKEGQVSETLAARFNWDKISNRHRRQNRPMYYLDKDRRMRVFYIQS